MKILFVHSANNRDGNLAIAKIQGESLKKYGLDIDYFPLKGKGFSGYLENIGRLRKFLRHHHYDVVHAHYSFCGLAARLAHARPLVVSFLGSDIYANITGRLILKSFHWFFNGKIIIKSKTARQYAGFEKAVVIPNGVDMEEFKPIPQHTARRETGFDKDRRYIIFIGNPQRYEKNFQLAQAAYDLLSQQDRFKTVFLKVVNDVGHSLIPFYMNAADVLLLTSLWEGSPNVIKEAMACNCPIVATDVGDVRDVTAGTGGCYITNFEPQDVAAKLALALDFARQNGRSDGRERIAHLDDQVIARKIIAVYEEVSR